MAMRKMIAGVLSFAMIVAMVPAVALADGEVIANQTQDLIVDVNGRTLTDGEDMPLDPDVTYTFVAQQPFYLESGSGDNINIPGIASVEYTDDWGNDYYKIENVTLSATTSILDAYENHISVCNESELKTVSNFVNAGGFNNDKVTTVMIASDITVKSNSGVTFNKDVVLDLHGNTITLNNSAMLAFGERSDSEIIDTYSNGGGTIDVQGNCILVKEHSNVSLDGIKVTGSGHYVMSLTPGTATINNCEIVVHNTKYTNYTAVVESLYSSVSFTGSDTSVRLSNSSANADLYLVKDTYSEEILVSGGSYSCDVSEYVDPDLDLVLNPDTGMYDVVEPETCKITLPDAVSASYVGSSTRLDPDSVLVGREIRFTSAGAFTVEANNDPYDIEVAQYDESSSKYVVEKVISTDHTVHVPSLSTNMVFRFGETVPAESSEYLGGTAENPKTKFGDGDLVVGHTDSYVTIGNAVTGIYYEEGMTGVVVRDGYGVYAAPFLFAATKLYEFPCEKGVYCDHMHVGDQYLYDNYVLVDVEDLNDIDDYTCLATLASDSYFRVKLSTGDVYAASVDAEDGKYRLTLTIEPGAHTYITDIESNIVAELGGYTLSLDGSIGVNYHVYLDPSIAADENTRMVFTEHCDDGDKVEIVYIEKATTKVVDGKSYYVFQCHVSAKETHDEITAKLYYGSSGKVFDSFTVKSYIEYLTEEHPDREKYQNFAYAMSYYGIAAQYYFDYETDDLSHYATIEKTIIEGHDNDTYTGYTAAAQAMGTIPSTIFTNNLPDNVTLEGISLVMKTTTKLKLYFKAPGEITATCTDKLVDVSVEKAGSYWVVVIDGITAQKLNSYYDLTITYNGQEGEVSADPMVYVSKVIEGDYDPKLQLLMKALVAYHYESLIL